MMRYGIILYSLFLLLMAQSTFAQEDDGFIPITADNFDQVVPLYSTIMNSTGSGYGFNSSNRLMQIGNSILDLTTYETFIFPNTIVSFGRNPNEIILDFTDSRERLSYQLDTQAIQNINFHHQIRVSSSSGRYSVTRDHKLIDTELDRSIDIDYEFTSEGWMNQSTAIFSQDERFVAIQTDFNVYQVIDLEKMEAVSYINTRGSIHFVDDSPYILVCEYNSRLIHHVTGEIRTTLNYNEVCVTSPDGQALIRYDTNSVSQRNAYIHNYSLFSLANMKFEYLHSISMPYAEKIIISPDKSLIFFQSTSNYQSTTHIYDIFSKTVLKTLPTSLHSIRFSDDGSLFVIISRNISEYSVWHYENSTLTPLFESLKHSALISSDNTTIALGGTGRTRIFYGIETPTRPRQPLWVQADIVPSSLNIRAEPKFDSEVIGIGERGITIVSGAQDGYFYLPEHEGWVLADPQYIRLSEPLTVDDFIGREIAYSPNELITVEIENPQQTAQSMIQPLDLTTASNQPLEIPSSSLLDQANGLPTITADNIASLALLAVESMDESLSIRPLLVTQQVNAEEKQILVNSYRDPYVYFFNYDDLTIEPAPSLERNFNNDQLINGKIIYYQDQGKIWRKDLTTNETIALGVADGFAIHPDQPLMLLLTASDQLITVIDTQTYETISEFNLSTCFCPRAFAQSQPYFASVNQYRVHIYDFMTGELLHQLDSPDTITDLKFSPDGDHLLISWRNNSGISIYSLVTDEIIWSTTHNTLFSKTQFTNDGRYVIAEISNARRLEIILMDVLTGEVISHYPLSNQSTPFTISPNGRLLATGNPIKVYDLSTGEILAELPYNIGYQSPFSFTPDSTRLISLTRQNIIIFGIPDETHPEWTGVAGRVVPSGINVRAEADANAEVIGYATGEVTILGRQNNMFYLKEYGGWVWDSPAYVDLGDKSRWDILQYYPQQTQ